MLTAFSQNVMGFLFVMIVLTQHAWSLTISVVTYLMLVRRVCRRIEDDSDSLVFASGILPLDQCTILKRTGTQRLSLSGRATHSWLEVGLSFPLISGKRLNTVSLVVFWKRDFSPAAGSVEWDYAVNEKRLSYKLMQLLPR